MATEDLSKGRAEGMTPESLHAELERLLTRLGVEIRVESMDEEAATWGGLCVLYGKSLLVIDSRLDLRERNGLMMECLRAFNLDGVYAAPYVREEIGRAQSGAIRTSDTAQSGPGNIP